MRLGEAENLVTDKLVAEKDTHIRSNRKVHGRHEGQQETKTSDLGGKALPDDYTLT